MPHLRPSNLPWRWLTTPADRRRPLLAGIVLALIGVVSPGAAQVQGTLFQGTVRPKLAQAVGAWCATEVGPTSFRRINTQRALMSFPALHYTLPTAWGATYYTLSGEARLIFSSPTAGTLRFDEPKAYPNDVLRPTFSNYSETYKAGSGMLVVKFNINFANCSVAFFSTQWS
jgi:hypothetical protein